VDAGLLLKPLYSLYLGREGQSEGPSELFLGGIDPYLFDGPLWDVDAGDFWQVTAEDIVVAGKHLGLFSNEVFIDSATTLITVPPSVARDIHSHIKGAVKDVDFGWILPCKTKESHDTIAFILNGKSFNVRYSDLVREVVNRVVNFVTVKHSKKPKPLPPIPVVPGYCYSGIDDTGNDDGIWTLGSVFIKNNYIVFNKGDNRISLAPKISHPKKHPNQHNV